MSDGNSTKYGCWFYLTDIGKDYELELEQFVVLPFVPLVGQTFQMTAGDNEGWDFCPHHVVYVVKEDVFWCNGRVGPPYCPCKPGEGCCETDKAVMPEHIAWLATGGWKVAEERRDKDRRFIFPGMFGDPPLHGIKIEYDED